MTDRPATTTTTRGEPQWLTELRREVTLAALSGVKAPVTRFVPLAVDSDVGGQWAYALEAAGLPAATT
jgi:hypothetical protein